MKLIESLKANVQLVESDRNNLPESVLSRATYCICNLGEKNANGRVYDKEVWEKVLSDSELQQKLADRCLFGHAEHPMETQSDLRETSHIIHKMWIDEASNKVYQTVDIVDTPTGRIVDCLLRAGSKVGMSTRAEGDLEEVELGEGVKVQRVVPESYQYKTTDFTADPSTYGVEPLDVRMNVAQTLQRELENKHMKAGDRAFAVKLLESLKVDESNISVNIEDKGQQTNIQVSGDLAGNTTIQNSAGINVSVSPTPEVPPGEEGGVLAGDMVAPEEEMPLEEPELAPGEMGLETPEEEEEKELPMESVEESEKLQEAKEELIINKVQYTGDGEPTSETFDYFTKKEGKKVGDVFVVWAGAPGTGKTTYEITRIDNKGIWGKQLESTVRELSPREVESVEESESKLKEEEDYSGYPSDQYDIVSQQKAQKFAVINLNREKVVTDWFDTEEEALDALKKLRSSGKESNESKTNESTDIKSQLTNLKIAEATARAECEKLIEELEESEHSELQVRMLQDRIKKIQETAEAEVNGLRTMLETKAADAASTTKQLQEAKTVAESKLDEYHKSHQAELVETANNAKLTGRNEVLAEYFDSRLAHLRLKVDTNTRALLEDCETLHDVDSLLEKIIGVARRGALHPEKIKEVKIQETVIVDAEQSASDKLVKGFLKSWT